MYLQGGSRLLRGARVSLSDVEAVLRASDQDTALPLLRALDDEQLQFSSTRALCAALRSRHEEETVSKQALLAYLRFPRHGNLLHNAQGLDVVSSLDVARLCEESRTGGLALCFVAELDRQGKRFLSLGDLTRAVANLSSSLAGSPRRVLVWLMGPGRSLLREDAQLGSGDVLYLLEETAVGDALALPMLQRLQRDRRRRQR